jgi:hypothetical protein
MSFSPSLPPGAPSLAAVLIRRTFDKPTQPFVDGEFIEALAHADDDRPSVTAVAAHAAATAAGGGGGTAAGSSGERPAAAATAPAAGPAPGSTVDVRV